MKVEWAGRYKYMYEWNNKMGLTESGFGVYVYRVDTRQVVQFFVD